MQTAIDPHEFKNDDPTWDFITEYPMTELIVDEDIEAELKIGSLSQTMQESGLPMECLQKLGEAIRGTAREASRHLLRGRPNLPVHIRLFCQRMPGDGLPHSNKQTNGGWGYYIIEKGGDFPSTIGYKYHRVLELYLYKEGG